jgi:hypothetical protein
LKYRKLGCRAAVEDPDEAAFLWCDQRGRELSFCLCLLIEDGLHGSCFAGSRDEKQYHTRPVDHT